MRFWNFQTSLAVLAALVVGSTAQSVPVNISQFSVSNPTVIYGANQTYGAVVISSPLFTGPFLWKNGTQTITTLSSLNNATSSGVFLGGIGFSYLETMKLAAGTYSAVYAVYPGGTSGTNTFTAADSRTTPLPDATFTVSPAPTELTLSYTPFTDANFTDAILLNVTNTAYTGAVPEGPVYEVITNSNGTLVGNYSLTLTTLNSNIIQAQLPKSFNAANSLGVGMYTAVYTYYPSTNFTQPTPLTITFQISNAAGPPSPPPPSPPQQAPPPPAPPAPLAGNGSTTLILEIYYNQQRNWLKACTGRTLVFWATVGATDVVQPIQGPKDGFIVFKGESGMIIGEGPVLAVSVGHVGLSVTFDYQDGSYGLGYGTHTGMPSAVTAQYTGSSNGTWLPSAASVSFTVPTTCTVSNDAIHSFEGKVGVAQQYAQGIVGSLVGGAPGTSIYGFGNNQGNQKGYPEGMYSPGSSLMASSGSDVVSANMGPSLAGEMSNDGSMASGMGSSG